MPTPSRPETPEAAKAAAAPFELKKAFNTPGFADFLGDAANYADADIFDSSDANAAEIEERWKDFQTHEANKKLLKTAGFDAFLKKFADAASFDRSFHNTETIAERFKIFESSKTIGRDFQNAYNEKLRMEKAGRLTPAEVTKFNDHAQELAISNPEEFAELQQELKRMQELPKEIAAAETELKKLAPVTEALSRAEAAREELQTKKEAHAAQAEAARPKAETPPEAKRIATVRETLAYFNNFLTSQTALEKKIATATDPEAKKRLEKVATLREVVAARKDVKASEKEVRALEQQIKETEALIAEHSTITTQTAERIAQVKDQFKDIRQAIFSRIPVAADIQARVSEEVKKRIDTTLASGNVTGLETLLKDVAHYDALAEEGDATNYFFGVDATTGTLTERNREELRQQVQQRIEEMVAKGIMDGLARITVGGTSEKLERAVNKFIDQAKKGLGIKNKDEARDFVLDTFREAEKAKGGRGILLRRLISIIEVSATAA